MRNSQCKSNKNQLVGLFISAFLVFSYNNIFMTITPVYLIELGGDAFLVGLQSSLFLISAIVFRFFFGPLADLKGTKITMLIGVGSFLVAGFFFIFSSGVWEIFVLRIIQAIGLAAYFPSASATVINYAPEGSAGKYIGIYRLVTTSTLLFGPIFALGIIDERGYVDYYLIMTITALIGLLFILPIENQVQSTKRKDKQKNPFSIKAFKGTSSIYLTTFILAISYGLLLNFTIIFLAEHTNISNPGKFYTLFAVGGILASLTLGVMSDKFGRLRIIVLSLLILGVGVIGFYFIPKFLSFFYLSGLLTGFGYSGGIIITMAWISESASEKLRSTALSLHQNCIDFGIAFGSSIFGIIMTKFHNFPTIFALIGVVIICYTFGLLQLKMKSLSFRNQRVI